MNFSIFYFSSSYILSLQVLNYLEHLDVTFPALLAAYEIEDTSVYPAGTFKAGIKGILDPIKYWQWVGRHAQSSPLKKFCRLVETIFVCPPSSAGLERCFSSFGLVHSKLRNRLGNEKVAKLVKIYTVLRDGDN